MANPQKNAIGLEIIVTVKNPAGAVIPLGSATDLKIRFRKPSAATIVRTAELATVGGADGKLKYITAAGDLDEAGTWLLQPLLHLADYDGPMGMVEMTVEENL